MELVGKGEDCIVLIPIVIAGSPEATLNEPVTGWQTIFIFETGSELVIVGRYSIWIQPRSKVVCVVLCIGRDKVHFASNYTHNYSIAKTPHANPDKN